MRTLTLITVLSMPFAAYAHEEHCHTKDDKGNLVDAKDLKNQKSCEAKGGSWTDHDHKPHDKAPAKAEDKKAK
ncbi:MAG: hypothetical protein QM723_13055 [Myxococcaceae bacterium]